MAGRQIVLNSNNDPDKDRDMVQHLLGMFQKNIRRVFDDNWGIIFVSSP